MTQNYENYDKRFQQCIDELVVLEKRAEERAEKLLKDHTYYQKKTQETGDDLAKKMTSVERSLSNICIASENIAGYMAQCEKHADRTRNVFMSTVVGCALVISVILWWAHDVNNDLNADEKEMAYFEELFRGMPEFQKVHGNNYARIVKGTETNTLKNDQGKNIEGRYAKLWYAP